MNIRNAKSVVVTFVLVMIIAVSLVTSLPANHPVSPPVADSTSPQPTPTEISSYIPRSEPARIELPSQPVPQQVVIQFAPETTDAERIEYVESIGGTVVESIESIDTVILDVPEEVASQPLPQSAKVIESEQDYYVTALDDLAPVNDPRYAEQWALPAIGAPSAWTELPADAPKVTVAVIDSGICASHPDLAGRIVDGWDFLESDTTPQDDFGHGCSVSGVIAANMNDGIGIAGVAPNAQIMPLRVLNASGVGSYSDVAAAIVYAADNGAQVINLSLGGSNPSSTLENAVNYAISKGVIVVAAAGNSGTQGALYPAAYPDVIAVGSVDPNLQHSTFSNYGSQIDVWAPGRDILTTKHDGSYGLVSGTSFAAPYVAGAEILAWGIGKNLALDGKVVNIQNDVPIVPTPTTSIDNTPIATATSPRTSDNNGDYIVYGLGNILYAQSVDSVGDLRELGQINSDANIVPSSDSDVYDIQLSPLKTLPPDNYGFYHGIWSPNRQVFVFTEMEDQELGYRIRLINTATDDAKNLLSDSIGNERGYLTPLIWRDNETVVLVERYMLDSLEKLRLWDLNIITGRIVFHSETATAQLFGKNFILTSKKTVFIGIDPDAELGYLYNMESDSLEQFSLSLPRTLTEGNNENFRIIDVIGVVQGDGIQQLLEQIQQQNVSVVVQRPAQFIYWPLADDVRPGILQYPATTRSQVLNLPYYGTVGTTTAHQGTDVKISIGTTVYAASTGWVVGVYNGCPNHTDASGNPKIYANLNVVPDLCVADQLQGYSNVTGANNNDDNWGPNPVEPDGLSWGVHNWGNSVMIQHTVTVSGQSKSWYTIYAHLKQNSIAVTDESSISKGSPVGQSGHNGISTLPHLHFEVRNHLTTGYYSWDDPWGSSEASVSSPDIGSVWVGGNSHPIAANGGGGGGTGKGCDQVSYNGVELYENENCNRDANGKTKSFSSATGLTDIVSDFNDITSSIYVKSGWSVKVFEKSIGEGGGSWRCITGNMWDLNIDYYTNGDTGRKIQNDISSVQVYDNSSDCNSGGGSINNPPAGFTFCAYEGGFCTFTGTADVVYGALNSFTAPRSFTNGIDCNNTKFVDPITGQTKACYFKLISPPPSCPQSGGVILYWNNNYSCSNSNGDAGYRLRSSTGWQNVNDGSFNDKSSSVKIPSGWSVLLYESADRGGGKVCYNSDISDFGAQGKFPGTNTDIQDQVSSMEVFSDSTCGGSNLPSSPSLSSPGNGSSNSYNYDLNFQWNSVSNATGYLVEWWGGPYGTMQPCVWVSSTSCHIGVVAQGNTYYWHVKARNGSGEGNWSSTWSFTIQTQPTAPSVPTLSNPGNSSSNPYNYDLNFQWNSIAGANDYLIEWWGGPYSTMQPCGWNTSTSCHIGTVSPGNTYYWHVKARNVYGESGWSPTWTFTIQSAPLPDLIPFPRPGASDPVVVSRWANSPYTMELISGQTAYYYWGFKNNGQSSSGAQHVKVYVDNIQFIDYPFGGLSAGSTGGFDNWSESFYVAPGAHQVKIVMDANGEVAESNETNNTWTGTVYWRSPTVQLDYVFTTDDLGPTGSDNIVPSGNVKTSAYKDTFNPGEPIRLYLSLTNELLSDQTFTGEWEVINPAGRVVSELSSTDTVTLGSGGWWWWKDHILPTNSIRGEYTFNGKLIHNGITTTQTTTFTINGTPAVEVYDVFVTDVNGNAASLEAIPQRSPTSEVGSKSVPAFNAGDGIRMYIDTYNDVANNEMAVFEWQVIDPWGRSVQALHWNGDLASSLGRSWWSLSPAIPSNAITGDYIFTGYITYNGKTTQQSQVFHVNGLAGPSNDNFSTPTIITTVPYSGSKDTWGATISATDPTSICGSGQNSNSVWYKYTPSINGTLHVDTFGSGYDTVVAVWTGSVSTLVLKGCNDDIYDGLQSLLEIPVTSGTAYYIEVMDFGTPGGGYLNLNIDFAQSVSNDDFNSPTIITTLPYNLTKDVRGATQANDDPSLTDCNRLPGQASVWYKYIPSISGQLVLDTSGSDYDTMLAVWSGTRGNLTLIRCNDDIGNLGGTWNSNSALAVQLQAGTTYYIEVSRYNGKIDVNGASAMETQDKPDKITSLGDVSSLQDKKAAVENGDISPIVSQEDRSGDVGAQFWGGQLQLHMNFRPTPANSILYMTENHGTLRSINQSTGSTTIAGNLGTNSIYGLSNRPGDTIYIYGVESSRLVKVNTTTGVSTPLPEFDKSVLGMSNVLATAIAISPATPNMAVVAGNNIAGSNYLWKVDLDTGSVLGTAIPTTVWIYELAYNPDGSLLYGVNSSGQLVTVNADTGAITLVGAPGLSSFIEGLAFRPSDGALFAIDGYDQDRLVKLDATNGGLLEIVGSLGVAGPNGLAFIPSYQMSVSKSGNGSGVVASNPAGINCGSTCSSAFNYNAVVTLTAVASTGSTFTGWSGGGCSGTGTCAVTMSTAQSVTATFTLNTYSLSISKSGTGSGTITSNPTGVNCGSTCSYSYNYNTPVTLTAIPSTGSTFTGWNGGGCSGTGACTVTMNAAQSIIASFYLIPTTPTLVSPLEGATLTRTNNTLLDWATTNGNTCTVHVWGGSIDISPSGSCADLALGEQRGGAYAWQVTSTNAYGSSTGPVWHFNVRPYAPTSLLASVASSTQVNLAWTLSSDEPADVDSYDVYKNGVLLTNIPKGTTNYSATGLTCNTSYSFYLRAKHQGVQSDNSNTVTITPPCPPAAFNKSSPANAAVSQPIGLTLSWAASTGASGYEYCIDTTSGSTCDTSWVGTGTAISVAVSNLAPSTTHYWQVRAVNSVDAAYANTSAWWSFTTGALPGSFTKISPSNNSTGQPVSPTLSWAGSAGATSYKYCYDTTNDNACGNWISAASATSAILSGLNYDTTYYWHVQALNAIGTTYSDGNTWRSFTTGHLPGGFNKNTPANLATSISINPTLSWFASASAVSYEYCISTTSAGCTNWVNVGNQTSVNLSNLAIDATYYWNVRAVNTTGTTTATDAIRSFTTVGIPSIFVKFAPANSTTVLLPPNVTLTWESSAGVVDYEYCLDTTNDSACQSNNWINANTNTNADLTGTLLANTTYYWQVRAINTYGIRYANGGTWWAFKTMAVPVAPVLALPITAYTTNDTTPAFSWNSVPAGNTYMIQIDNDSTFTSPVQIYTTASGAPLTYVATPLADGAYYWRVKAINVSNESGVWSASRTFIIDTVPASAPLLSTPADNGFTALPKPILGVLAVTGATRYQFQVSAEIGFGSLVVDANNITTTSYTLTTALPYGRYYWRALAVDAAGNLSAWSAVRSFTVTFMSAPIDGGFAATDIPTFTWTTVTGALEYHLQVDETDSFAIPELERYQSSGTTYISLSSLDYGIHYWRMQIRTAGGWSSWTPAWRLTLTPPLATPPALVNPANVALITDNTPDLTWNMVLADDRYQVQVDNLSTFASPEQVFTSGVGALAYTATTLPDGVWYWRVRTINYLDVPSVWSAYRSFTVDTTGPVAPTLSAPANTASVIGTPAFSWTAAATATKYQFEYDNNVDFSSPIYTSIDLTTTSHTPPAMALGTYSWHVRGKDAAGNWGAWSATRTVTILPVVPVAPVLVTPAASAVTNDSTPDFTWNSVVSGNTYELEISNASTFAAKQQTFAGGVGVLTYTATNIPDGVWYWHVRALNVNSAVGVWSAYRSFTVDTTGPVAPVLSAPANVTSVIGTPAFSWAAAATATKYQFEYDNDADFSSPTYTSIDLTTTSHTPPAIALGAYSWHVRGKDAAGNWGPWSTARTVTILPAVPVVPVLVNPAASAVTNDSTPDFTWNSVVSGNTYELEISNASTFAAKQQTFAGGVGILTYTATTIPDGVWYWHVRALNVNSAVGAWSAYRSFTVDTTGPVAPTLSAPANTASVIGTPAFSWAAAATATKYQFEYDNDADFSSPIYTSADLTTTSHTPPAMAIGTYSWHVRGKDAAGNWGAWSATRTVTILPVVPVAPVLVTPVASAVTNDSTPDFTWNSVVSGNTYELEISNASTFAAKQQTFAGGVGVLTYTATNIPDGVWYWHVRALNVNGVAGAWGVYRSFTVDTTGPVAPTLSAPANAASVIGTPAFSWAAAATATKYQFEYDNDADFSSPTYTSIDLTTTSHTPPAIALGAYSWHVRGKDAAGNWGAWSTARTVTILPAVPVAPTLATPAASVVTNDPTPDFAWNSVVSGNTYELEISNASTFAIKQQTFAGGVGVLNYSATNIPDGVWYWHVRALNVNGGAGAWSAYRSFTVDTAGPVAPVLSAPANAASVNGTPAFSWAAAATATKYQFECDNDADFSSPIYTSADLTTTSHTPPAMAIGTYSWHVRGKDAAGNWGAWSTTRIVSIIPLVPASPTLTSPANGSISQNPAPALNWTVMPNAASYEVQMDNNSTFSSPEFDGNSATNTITPTSLADGIYYWRVRQTNILGGTSLWSTAWRVTISQPIPAAPNGNSLRSLELPTSDTGLPTFNWSSVEYGMTYQLQVADNETFTDSLFDDTAETTERTLTEPLAIGEYFWRVRAINEYGTAGPWTETWTITVDIPPAAPTLLLPSEATVSLNGEASFSWQDAENAEKYQIQVDDAEDFSSPEFDDTATQITRELVTALTDGTYFWRVRGLNIYDTAGEWSDVRSFTVSIPPAAPTLLTPEVDSTDETGLPAFEWEAVLNSVTYQIQVDNNADFSSPEFDDTAETITRELETPLENGIYYWRVRAIKADDTLGEWSLVWSFTVNVP